MDFEDQLQELSEDFKFELNDVQELYNYLMTKECFSLDESKERKYECLYRILFELAEIENRKEANNNINSKYSYKSTSDFAINKGLFESYQKESINDLSDDFIEYLSREISYNGKSKLDNFNEEYNFETNDDIENYHYK